MQNVNGNSVKKSIIIITNTETKQKIKCLRKERNMNNYFMLNGRKIPLTDEQAEEIKTSLGLKEKQLKDIPVGDTFKAGDYEFIVFEQMGEKTAVILKNLLHENVKFGKNNNYNGSNADNTCISFVQKIADIIGKDNIYEHEVDLTSANGMTCYGKITRRMSLLTLERLQKYGHILAKHKVEKWWWLATANGTKNAELMNTLSVLLPRVVSSTAITTTTMAVFARFVS